VLPPLTTGRCLSLKAHELTLSLFNPFIFSVAESTMPDLYPDSGLRALRKDIYVPSRKAFLSRLPGEVLRSSPQLPSFRTFKG